MIKTAATEPETVRRSLTTRPGVHFSSLVGRLLRAIGCRPTTRSLKHIERPLPSPDMSYSRLSPELMRIEVRLLDTAGSENGSRSLILTRPREV
jgi:hypothetical protein